MPQNAAGMRQDPPVSVPSATTAMPSATDTAAPLLLPPGTLPHRHAPTATRACHDAG